MLSTRNKEGKVDIACVKNINERKGTLNMKYEKKCRLGLGVAMVTHLGVDSAPLSSVRRRYEPFDYSTKVMIFIDDYQRLKKAEFE